MFARVFKTKTRVAVAVVVGTYGAAMCTEDGRRLLATTHAGTLARVILAGANNLELKGEVQAFHDLVMRRPQGLGLLTASNHASTFDDPPLMVSIVPGSILLHPHLVRWALCAEDVCFKRKSALDKCLSTFFDTGKVLPVRRGGGIRQDMLMAPVNKLREGDWVHIFPEGRVYPDSVGVFRRGVGRLISEVKRDVVVVPFYHDGMQRLQPYDPDPTVIYRMPRFGQKVTVWFGKPIRVEDLLEGADVDTMTDDEAQQLFERVSNKIREEVLALQRQHEAEQQKQLLP